MKILNTAAIAIKIAIGIADVLNDRSGEGK
jgi:hypothetical protein